MQMRTNEQRVPQGKGFIPFGTRGGNPEWLDTSPISAGLLALIECWWSHIMNCPCPSQSSDCCFISGWALTRYRLSEAGLQGQACQDIYVAAHFAPVGPWVMSGTAFLSVRVLMATG